MQVKHSKWPVDPWRWAAVLSRRGRWMLLGAVGLALAGAIWGYQTGRFSVAVWMTTRKASVDGGLASGPTGERVREFGGGGVGELIRSGIVRRSAGKVLGAPLASDQIAITQVASALPGEDLIRMQLADADRQRTVVLANEFAAEAARTLTELRRAQIQELDDELARRLESLDRQLKIAAAELVEFQQGAPGLHFEKDPQALLAAKSDQAKAAQALRNQLDELDRRIARLLVEIRKMTPALVAARTALAQALTRFTEQHPKVKELRAALAAVEARVGQQDLGDEIDVSAWGNPAATTLYAEVVELRNRKISVIRQLEELNVQTWNLEQGITDLPMKHAEYLRLKSRYEALKTQRFELANQRQRGQMIKSLEPVKIIRPAAVQDVDASPKIQKAVFFGVMGGGMGLVLGVLFIGCWELFRGRIWSESDLAQATNLPVLASLDDVRTMDREARMLWAMRLWTIVKNRVALPERGALICGVTSSVGGEGRSTVIRLLAEAAREHGLRVYAIQAGKNGMCLHAVEANVERAGEGGESTSGGSEPQREMPGPGAATPGGVPLAKELALWESGAWNLELHQQWQQALAHWSAAAGSVIFIELPPVVMPEAFMLADRVPYLLWVGRKNMAKEHETRSQLGLLGCPQSRWIGAVFNRALARPRSRIPGLAGLMGLILSLAAWPLFAQPKYVGEPDALRAGENQQGSLSISSPAQLAPWQKHLTLGPGDVVNVSLYEQPDTARAGIFVGPDGRINYLEAQDVVASGLTVDELRAKLEEVLSKYRLSPRVVIHPVTYASKKYYVLGNVAGKGVYYLDRPVTIVEAIARAGGFVTQQQYRNTMTQADLTRSFLVRRGEDGSFGRVQVDFEGLFQRGDLSQNIALAPDDYLFFPPLDLQEVYVLGEVNGPGPAPFSKGTTALGAILSRGGFSPRAFKSRVLIVRGSLNRPQTFVVNIAKIKSARGPDFPLQNRDIIYVHQRPFAKAAELLETAVIAFGRSMAIGYAGQNVGPFITEPIFR